MVLWQAVLPSDGVGGIAASRGLVVVGCRDLSDQDDLFLAFDAQNGLPLWQVQYPAPGALDYGNSPRATPLIDRGKVYLLGALGHLTCVDAKTGLIQWQRDLGRECQIPALDWGLAGSPLISEGKLIVQPGGERGSLLALNPETGETIWQWGTVPPGHSSPVTISVGGRKQLISYDKWTLGGWDLKTGQRLWSVVPRRPNDFNVPTPIVIGKRLFVATENNGSRIYDFDDNGILKPLPSSHEASLCPDSHTPVVVGDRIIGVSEGLHCLSISGGLSRVWISDDEAFQEYASLIASSSRVLALTMNCELVLFSPTGQTFQPISRLSLSDDGTETLSHPAIMNKRLYVRLGQTLQCLALELPR